jgi:triosephosphate isomerase
MKIIIANWKSNKNEVEAGSWLKIAVPALKSAESKIVIAPAFNLLTVTSNLIKGTNLVLGTQDISPFPAGAYTGAVGVKNLEALGVTYAIVGHSERRRYFHETSNEIANKVREALAAGITPIVCVTKDTVSEQGNAIEPELRSKVVVAFEPIENIGTGVSDTLEDILATKEMVKQAFGEVPYIYGGSVDQKTETQILTHPEIDGFLVGGASLNAENFVSLVKLIS